MALCPPNLHAASGWSRAPSRDARCRVPFSRWGGRCGAVGPLPPPGTWHCCGPRNCAGQPVHGANVYLGRGVVMPMRSSQKCSPGPRNDCEPLVGRVPTTLGSAGAFGRAWVWAAENCGSGLDATCGWAKACRRGRWVSQALEAKGKRVSVHFGA